LWVASDAKRGEAQTKFNTLPTLPAGACTTSDCKAVHDELAAQAALQTGATIAWGVAGAAAAGGAGKWVFSRPGGPLKAGAAGGAAAIWIFRRLGSPERAGARVVPIVGGSRGGLVVGGFW